jgi:hypothetical protein
MGIGVAIAYLHHHRYSTHNLLHEQLLMRLGVGGVSFVAICGHCCHCCGALEVVLASLLMVGHYPPCKQVLTAMAGGYSILVGVSDDVAGYRVHILCTWWVSHYLGLLASLSTLLSLLFGWGGVARHVDTCFQQ